MFYKNSALPSH